ncbi:MAG: serine/threonine-protein kinase [Gemmatimonadales bacterium]|nr:serine/threonine-protein kinase [Gemmatimonadales bacterium]
MPPNDLIGRSIAGYRLLGHVGEGGTAEVYRAEHAEKGRVAVKILRGRLAQDPVAVKRFLREASYGARVTHPNIVQTYDYGEADGVHYLALEWAEGESLAAFAQRSGKLASGLVATIIEQLGGALAEAHGKGIIHRDLKPANIMYDPATQRAKLLDFGIARDTESKDERLTRAGFFVGTLQYVAPEALSGELVGEQADVYSLATIAYFLLSGQLPFQGKNPRELFQQLLTKPATPLNQADPELKFPAEVEAAIMWGLEREVAKRCPTVTAFADRFVKAVRESEAAQKKGGGFLGAISGIFKKPS